MENHKELSDFEFEQQFEKCSLDPNLFTHEAHLRLAWIHINKYGIDKAIENVNIQLINFVDILGAKDKYNKTLTIAALKAVNHFICKSKSENFNDFILEFPRLRNNFKELMSLHYSIDVFNSKQAKAEYLEPDLLFFTQ